jgi:hypothetical protein
MAAGTKANFDFTYFYPVRVTFVITNLFGDLKFSAEHHGAFAANASPLHFLSVFGNCNRVDD